MSSFRTIKDLFSTIFGYNRKTEDYEFNEGNIRYASLPLRMLASTLDMAIIVFITSPIISIIYHLSSKGINSATINNSLSIEAQQGLQVQALILLNLIPVIIYIVTAIYLIKKHGGTPGKIFLRLRVINSKTFKPIGYRQAIIRIISYSVSLLPLCLGVIWADFDKKKQTFHDKIADTLVVKLPKYTKAQLRNTEKDTTSEQEESNKS